MRLDILFGLRAWVFLEIKRIYFDRAVARVVASENKNMSPFPHATSSG